MEAHIRDFDRWLKIPSVKSVSLFGNCLELYFNSPVDSYSAFNKMRDFGVSCAHAGINAPCGPTVMLSNHNNRFYIRLV